MLATLGSSTPSPSSHVPHHHHKHLSPFVGWQSAFLWKINMSKHKTKMYQAYNYIIKGQSQWYWLNAQTGSLTGWVLTTNYCKKPRGCQQIFKPQSHDRFKLSTIQFWVHLSIASWSFYPNYDAFGGTGLTNANNIIPPPSLLAHLQ